MKRNILSLFTMLVLFTYCSGNKIEDRFLSDLDDYSAAYNKTDWEKVVSMIYPKLFVIISKEDMIQTMKKLDSVGIKMKLEVKKIEKVTDIITSGTEKFCRIDYNSQMTVSMSPEQQPNIPLYKESFEANFGKENVKFNDEKKQFEIDAHQSMVAVADKDSDTWKYIEFNGGQADYILTRIMPEEVLNKLKK